MGIGTIADSLLCILIAAEGALIQRTLYQVRQWKPTSPSNGETEQAQFLLGSNVPEFIAPILRKNQVITSSTFRGRHTILLFLSALRNPGQYANLATSVHALWHKSDEHLYIVCTGNETECEDLVDHNRVSESIPVIIDSDGSIAGKFSIKHAPAAVFLDENLTIQQYGEPTANDEPRE